MPPIRCLAIGSAARFWSVARNLMAGSRPIDKSAGSMSIKLSPTSSVPCNPEDSPSLSESSGVYHQSTAMTRSTPTRLGEQIKRLRQQRGLSQQALAVAAGVSRDYVAKLEAGERASPSMPVLERLAKALGVKVRVTLAK